MLSLMSENSRLQLQAKKRQLTEFFVTKASKNEWLKIYNSFIKGYDLKRYDAAIRDVLQEKKFFLSQKAWSLMRGRESVIVDFN